MSTVSQRDKKLGNLTQDLRGEIEDLLAEAYDEGYEDGKVDERENNRPAE